MRATSLFLVCLVLAAMLSFSGCARHTYYVSLNDGRNFYADPPLILDTKNSMYHMRVGGKTYLVPMEDIFYLDDAIQVCYANGFDDTYTCLDALYQY